MNTLSVTGPGLACVATRAGALVGALLCTLVCALGRSIESLDGPWHLTLDLFDERNP